MVREMFDETIRSATTPVLAVTRKNDGLIEYLLDVVPVGYSFDDVMVAACMLRKFAQIHDDDDGWFLSLGFTNQEQLVRLKFWLRSFKTSPFTDQWLLLQCIEKLARFYMSFSNRHRVAKVIIQWYRDAYHDNWLDELSQQIQTAASRFSTHKERVHDVIVLEYAANIVHTLDANVVTSDLVNALKSVAIM